MSKQSFDVVKTEDVWPGDVLIRSGGPAQVARVEAIGWDSAMIVFVTPSGRAEYHEIHRWDEAFLLA